MSTLFNTFASKDITVKKPTIFNAIELIETNITPGANFLIKIKLLNSNGEQTEEIIQFSENELDAFQFAYLTDAEIETIENAQSISKKMHLLLGYYIARKLKNEI